MKLLTKSLFLCGLLAATAANAQESAIIPEDYIHVVPAEGEVASLSLWSISFDGEWSLENRSSKFVVTAPEGVAVPSVYSYSTGATYIVYLDGDTELTTPGQYTFTIPAGKFGLGENGKVVNPELTYTYTITGSGSGFPQYTAIPEPGTYTALNDGFKIIFDSEDVSLLDASQIHLFGPEDEISVTTEVPRNMSYLTVIPVGQSGNPVDLVAPGTYTLVLGPGSISASGIIIGKDISFVYNVQSGAQGGTWNGAFTADPAAGSTLSSLKHIDITFDGASSIKISDSARPSDFPHVYDASGTLVTSGIAFASDNVMQISLSSEIVVPGNYKLVISKEFFTVDGSTPTDDLTIEYNIGGSLGNIGYTTAFTPEPGSTLSYSGEVTLTFAGENLASVTNNEGAWGNNAPHFTSAQGYYCPFIQVVKNGFEFSLNHTWEFEHDGEYHLVIPAAYFTVTSTDGTVEPSPAFDVVYNVSGGTTSIGSVTVESANVEIYNVQGVRVNGQPSQGIYIINGKKAIIR